MNATKFIKTKLANMYRNAEAVNMLNIKELYETSTNYENSIGLQKFEIGRQLYTKLKSTGHISCCIALLEELIVQEPKKKFLQRELDINKDKLFLLNEFGVNKSSSMKSLSPSGDIGKDTQQNKILHVLNTSMPYLNNGYGIRSKFIIETQKKMGIKPIVVTRPGFPNDFSKDAIKEFKDIYHESIDSTIYYRILLDEFMRYTPIMKYINDFSNSLKYIIDSHNPRIIHAASNYVIGMAALQAARGKQKPFIYEIRGFWELTKASKEPLYMDSEDFKLTQIMETYLAMEADRIIVISEQLKKQLLEREVDESKISIIPNGVDCSKFKPIEYNTTLADKHEIRNVFTIGYIGSLVKYEGLQSLLKAVYLLKTKGGPKMKVLIIGDGEYKAALEDLSNQLNLDETVSFIGRVPHEEVAQYYSIFDVCVYPRIKEQVTEIVTPLKPLEAMACGKAVLAADLDALREMIIPNTNGILFDNTEIDLANKLELLIQNPDLRIELGCKARKWVETNRDWTSLVAIYSKVYSDCSHKL